MHTRRWAVAAAVVAALAWFSTNRTLRTDDGANNEAAAHAVTDAFSVTTAAHSARISAAWSMNLGPRARPEHFSMRGVTMLDGSAAEMHVDLDSSSVTRSLLSPRAGDPMAVDARFVDGLEYVDFRQLTAAVTGHGVTRRGLRTVRWVRAPLEGQQIGNFGVGVSPASFTIYLQLLRVAPDAKVTRVGTDVVAGTKTTHYRLIAEPAAVVQDLQSPRMPAAVVDLVQFVRPVSQPLVIDVEIDSSGHIRRLTVRSVVIGARATVAVIAVMELAAFDTPVHVAAPPAAETRAYDAVYASLFEG